MRRWVLLAPVLVVLATGVMSCSDTTAGQAVAGGQAVSTDRDPGSSPSTPGRITTSSKPGPGDSPLTNIDPCSLLTPAGRTQLGVDSGQKDDSGGDHGCLWRQRGPTGTNTLAAYLVNNQGLAEVPASANVKQLPDVGRHKAIQTSGSGGPGSCSVLLGVTDSSMVDNAVIAGTNGQKACSLAMDLARLVEPQLP